MLAIIMLALMIFFGNQIFHQFKLTTQHPPTKFKLKRISLPSSADEANQVHLRRPSQQRATRKSPDSLSNLKCSLAG